MLDEKKLFLTKMFLTKNNFLTNNIFLHKSFDKIFRPNNFFGQKQTFFYSKKFKPSFDQKRFFTQKIFDRRSLKGLLPLTWTLV